MAAAHAQDYAHISVSTNNIGDDIQSIAARRFLPDDSIGIDRDYVSEFKADSPVKTLMNGWFLLAKGHNHSLFPLPDKCWPPSSDIDPLIISFHLGSGLDPYILSDEGVEYLKAHAPIGTRDISTLGRLQSKGIPSYFSGCMTLTLENDANERNEHIVAVDLDEASLAYLKAHTSRKVVTAAHTFGGKLIQDPVGRVEYARQFLDLYKRAACVVTSRLHVFLPCLAFETPVLFICYPKDIRFGGLMDLGRHCSRAEFVNGEYDFDFDNPTPNPDDYKLIRNNLITIVKAWRDGNPLSLDEINALYRGEELP